MKNNVELTKDEQALLDAITKAAGTSNLVAITIVDLIEGTEIGYLDSAITAAGLSDKGVIEVDFLEDSDKILFQIK